MEEEEEEEEDLVVLSGVWKPWMSSCWFGPCWGEWNHRIKLIDVNNSYIYI